MSGDGFVQVEDCQDAGSRRGRLAHGEGPTEPDAGQHALDVLAPDVPRAPKATGATYEAGLAYVGQYTQRRTRFAEAYAALARD
ncbi:hypothetical protein ACFYPG_05895 [Micromonospora sp. NPDC005553]|uniref:hypothetical protein n=1 Tax=Micromonospora sp. NPDC005553 TaxID=3364232 RepID=UPI00367951ED